LDHLPPKVGREIRGPGERRRRFGWRESFSEADNEPSASELWQMRSTAPGDAMIRPSTGV
jgi:hypothetical protein